jgi:hypothetical protein
MYHQADRIFKQNPDGQYELDVEPVQKLCIYSEMKLVNFTLDQGIISR